MEIYDILLNTPLGKKSGELSVNMENGKLLGFLSLLGHTEPIEGTIDKNGNCLFQGKVVTLLNTICFMADGIIKDDVLSLKIKSDSSIYEMKGTLRNRRERDS